MKIQKSTHGRKIYKKHIAIVSEKDKIFIHIVYLLAEHRTLIVQTKYITEGRNCNSRNLEIYTARGWWQLGGWRALVKYRKDPSPYCRSQ
jgi:hypothetical protein